MGSEDQVIVWRFEAELFQDEKYDSTRHGMAPKIVGSAQAKNIVMATSARGVSLDKGRRAVLLSNHLFTPRAFCKPSPVKEAIRFGELDGGPDEALLGPEQSGTILAYPRGFRIERKWAATATSPVSSSLSERGATFVFATGALQPPGGAGGIATFSRSRGAVVIWLGLGAGESLKNGWPFKKKRTGGR